MSCRRLDASALPCGDSSFRYAAMSPPLRISHAIASAASRGRLRYWCVAMALNASLVAHALTQDEVIAGSQLLYAKRITALEDANALDVDAAFAARVQRIAERLILQAKRDYPETAAWPWEVHTTIDPDQNADCMAGGKILLSRAYAERLELSDAELAMLLAHEIEHATLRHNLKEYELAMRLDPRWSQRPFVELEDAVDNDAALVAQLAPLDFAQEVEPTAKACCWRGAPAGRRCVWRRISRRSCASAGGRTATPIRTRRRPADGLRRVHWPPRWRRKRRL